MVGVERGRGEVATLMLCLLVGWCQVRLMAEECILVDENDNVVGHDSKKNCWFSAPSFFSLLLLLLLFKLLLRKPGSCHKNESGARV